MFSYIESILYHLSETCLLFFLVCFFNVTVFIVLKGMDDVQVRGAATDIFSYLVEYNPSMVREFVMQESQQNDDVSHIQVLILSDQSSFLNLFVFIHRTFC